ncbi:metallopeptidase family protein [Salipiger abyssi]|uniref:metallopeptidase family protein n=1 Tax=Salipiger abyssi TaxID=1250539 RepID=UPI001A8F0B35|nr:metallopeptidase family protein [Salipiger abyssi]MBN9885995.1 metallopeptidase family protein [Salipiger abyssi]
MSDPDLSDFDTMARAAVAQFPEPFRQSAAEVVLQVVDWPPEGILREMNIADPLELTGLYEGIPMTERSLTFPSPYPDRVWLFRQPILEEWRERGDIALADLVTHVTVHEFAHHFGWSDDDIATIDRWWE